MEMCPYSYFWWCEYFWGPWVSFVMTDKFSVRVTKITWRIGVLWTHSIPFYFQPILWKRSPPLSQQPSSKNWGRIKSSRKDGGQCMHTMDILILCETNLDDSTDSCNFSQSTHLLKIIKVLWMISSRHVMQRSQQMRFPKEEHVISHTMECTTWGNLGRSGWSLTAVPNSRKYPWTKIWWVVMIWPIKLLVC